MEQQRMASRISEYFKLRKQEKEEFSAFLEDLKRKISIAEQEYQEIFRNSSTYVDIQTVLAWKNKFSRLHDDASSYLKDGMIEKKKLPRQYLEPFGKMDAMYDHIDKKRTAHNRKAVAGHEWAAQEAFRRVIDAKPTEYQIDAILAENRRILISGAPSTGKTTALKAKISYIKNRGLCEGKDFMFLRGGDLKGFAAFACKILEECGVPAGYKSPEADILPGMIEKFLAEKSVEASYRSRLIDYYFKFHSAGHTAFEYKDYKEYEEYIALFPPVSLKGEKLKSYEELDVANFLFALGVEYEYHAPFSEDAMVQGARTRYKPDFTLKDYHICINVYQIDEDGNTAEEGVLSFSQKENITKQYWESIHAVREIHEEAEIPLIECYTRDKHSGGMLPKLQAGLSSHGVEFNIKSDQVLFEAILNADPAFLTILAESIRYSTEAILASDLTEEEILTLSRTKSRTAAPLYKRRERLMSLILPFYNDYLAKVPCDDYRIVTRAANVLSDYKAPLEYRYLFLDDLENMNSCAIRLVTELSENCRCGIVAAGCGWCSMVGRYGADPVYMQDFGRFFPGFDEFECTRVFDLPKEIFSKMRTFALNGSSYMEYDPLCLNTDSSEGASGKIELVLIHYDNEINIREKFTELLASLPENQSVLIACRYDADVAFFAGCIGDRKNTDCRPIFCAQKKYDVVIWCNTKYTNFGFPDERLGLNNISDLLLRRPDSFQSSGERNLLCKAMSLTRGRFILLCDVNNASPYVAELGLLKE